MKAVRIALIVLVLIVTVLRSEASSLSKVKKDSLPAIQGYPIVDTDQKVCYNNKYVIPAQQPGEPFYGQDAQYIGIIQIIWILEMAQLPTWSPG